MQFRVVLAADLIPSVEMRRLILHQRVVRDRLLGPGGVFRQVVAAALLLDVDETRHPVVLKDFVTLFV